MLFKLIMNNYTYTNNTKSINVKGKTPLAAAKKLWKNNKHLITFSLTDKTGVVYNFNANTLSRNGKFIK